MHFTNRHGALASIYKIARPNSKEVGILALVGWVAKPKIKVLGWREDIKEKKLCGPSRGCLNKSSKLNYKQFLSTLLLLLSFNYSLGSCF